MAARKKVYPLGVPGLFLVCFHGRHLPRCINPASGDTGAPSDSGAGAVSGSPMALGAPQAAHPPPHADTGRGHPGPKADSLSHSTTPTGHVGMPVANGPPTAETGTGSGLLAPDAPDSFLLFTMLPDHVDTLGTTPGATLGIPTSGTPELEVTHVQLPIGLLETGAAAGTPMMSGLQEMGPEGAARGIPGLAPPEAAGGTPGDLSQRERDLLLAPGEPGVIRWRTQTPCTWTNVTLAQHLAGHEDRLQAALLETRAGQDPRVTAAVLERIQQHFVR